MAASEACFGLPDASTSCKCNEPENLHTAASCSTVHLWPPRSGWCGHILLWPRQPVAARHEEHIRLSDIFRPTDCHQIIPVSPCTPHGMGAHGNAILPRCPTSLAKVAEKRLGQLSANVTRYVAVTNLTVWRQCPATEPLHRISPREQLAECTILQPYSTCTS